MKKINVLILFSIAVLLGSPAAAQEWGSGRGGGPRGGPSDEKRDEVRKKVEALWVWKITEELKLDEETAAKLLPSVSSLRKKHRALRKENRGAMHELRNHIVAQTPDRKKLMTVISRIERNRIEMHRLSEQEFKTMRRFLTPEQQARYLFFQRQFRREMRRMIFRARGEVRGMKGRRGGAGPGWQGGPAKE